MKLKQIHLILFCQVKRYLEPQSVILVHFVFHLTAHLSISLAKFTRLQKQLTTINQVFFCGPSFPSLWCPRSHWTWVCMRCPPVCFQFIHRGFLTSIFNAASLTESTFWHLPTTTTFFSAVAVSSGAAVWLLCAVTVVFLRLVPSLCLSSSVNDLDRPLLDIILSLVSVRSRWFRSCSVNDRTRTTLRFLGDALTEKYKGNHLCAD